LEWKKAIRGYRELKEKSREEIDAGEGKG